MGSSHGKVGAPRHTLSSSSVSSSAAGMSNRPPKADADETASTLVAMASTLLAMASKQRIVHFDLFLCLFADRQDLSGMHSSPTQHWACQKAKCQSRQEMPFACGLPDWNQAGLTFVASCSGQKAMPTTHNNHSWCHCRQRHHGRRSARLARSAPAQRPVLLRLGALHYFTASRLTILLGASQSFWFLVYVFFQFHPSTTRTISIA